MNKQEFIDRLKDITPQEINKIIKEKGKSKKPYRPFIIVIK
jgi:hypothetical protein